MAIPRTDASTVSTIQFDDLHEGRPIVQTGMYELCLRRVQAYPVAPELRVVSSNDLLSLYRDTVQLIRERALALLGADVAITEAIEPNSEGQQDVFVRIEYTRTAESPHRVSQLYESVAEGSAPGALSRVVILPTSRNVDRA